MSGVYLKKFSRIAAPVFCWDFTGKFDKCYRSSNGTLIFII